MKNDKLAEEEIENHSDFEIIFWEIKKLTWKNALRIWNLIFSTSNNKIIVEKVVKAFTLTDVFWWIMFSGTDYKLETEEKILSRGELKNILLLLKEKTGNTTNEEQNYINYDGVSKKIISILEGLKIL